MSSLRSFYDQGGIGGAYFSREHATGSRQKFTIAKWVKILAGEAGPSFRVGGDQHTSADLVIKIHDDKISCYDRTDDPRFLVEGSFVDYDVWRLVTIAVDTTAVTASNRVRIYAGETECSYISANYPDQNLNILSTDQQWWIATDLISNPFKGGIDLFHFVDNAQLSPSSFISAGAPIPFTGNWGAAGFLLDFENATSPATMGYDTSGHGFNFVPTNVAVATNSSTDVPGVNLVAAALAGASLVIGVPTFDSGMRSSGLSAGSPQLSSPIFASAIPNSLSVSSPALTHPTLVIHGKNILPNAANLSSMPPLLGSPYILAFTEVSLGTEWGITNNVIIGGPFIDAKPQYDAVALIDEAGTSGPYEIYQTVNRTAEVGTYRLMFDVAPTGSGKYVEIGITDDSIGGVSAIFDPETGECLARNPLVVGSATVQSDWKLIGVEADPLLNHFYRLQIIAQVDAAAAIRAYIRLANASLQSDYSGNGNGSVFVSDPRLYLGMDQRQFRWEIGEPEMRFYWTAHLNSLGLRWFRCGQGELGVDHHLEFIDAPDLECVFRRWQPAQDDLVFDYSGYLIAGSSNPMEGTP